MEANRRTFIKGAGALAAAGMVAAPAVVRAQERFQWKAQCLWSAAELTYKTFEEFCAHVKELTNGRLEITPFAAGAVVGVFETLDAVQAGILQAHSTWPGYFTGKEPGLAVATDFVFAYDDPNQQAIWYYERGGLDVLREMYAKFGVYTVGVGWWGVESLVSKKPLRTVEDFRGMKIRSPQGMTAEIFTKLGASAVILPGTEVYSALDKGVVDAADWATPSMNNRIGLFEVAKYSVKVYHSMPVQDFSVNQAAWKALPDDLKRILTAAVRDWAWDQILRVADADAKVVAELPQKKVETIVWKGDELRKLRDIAQGTWKEWSGKSPLAKRAYDGQIALLKELGLA